MLAARGEATKMGATMSRLERWLEPADIVHCAALHCTNVVPGIKTTRSPALLTTMAAAGADVTAQQPFPHPHSLSNLYPNMHSLCSLCTPQALLMLPKIPKVRDIVFR